MVRFLHGDLGTGKSTYILNSIKADYENGVRSFLIVPEQQTVVKERQIATLLPMGAQLYCEALNFSRLSNRVFRDMGGLKTNYVTKSGKNLLMYRAICACRDELTEYKISKEHEKGSIKLLLDMIAEFKSFNVTTEKLEIASKKIADEKLKSKLCDILKIWSTYEALLNESFSDPFDNLSVLAEKIEESNYFKGANVYIDSFYAFSLAQVDVIREIIKSANNVVFAFDSPIDATEKSIQFAMVSKNSSAIKRLCEEIGIKTECISFNTDYKHKAKDMAVLSKYIWDFSKVKYASSENITLVKCTDEFDECEYASSEICKLVMSGYKYSEIAIIARSVDTYRGILDYTLKKYNIPHFMSSPTDWLTKPILKMIFSAIGFSDSGRRDELLSFAKSGYLDIEPSLLSEFESYIKKWDIYGKKFFDDDYWNANPDGFVEKQTEEQKEALKRIIKTRDLLLGKLLPLNRVFIGGATVIEACGAVYEFLSSLDIVEKLENERKSVEKAEAYIISQVWEAILDALDTLANICKDNEVDAVTFSTLLYYAFVDAKVGTIPTGEDNVIISDAHSVRAEGIRHVFILGANEGSFPASVTDSSIFSESERKELKDAELSFSIDKDFRSDDELLFFKTSVAIASEGAHVCALESGIDGSARKESIGYKRIEELFSEIKKVETSKLDTINKIFTPFVAREHFGTASNELKEAIKAETQEELTSKYTFTNEESTISEETTNLLFGSKLKLSQSQISLFKDCKFKYYAERHLGLNSNKSYSFSSLESGTLVHSIFEHFTMIIRDKGDTLFALSEDELRKEIKVKVDSLTDAYISFVCRGVYMTNRLKHHFDRLKRNLYIFIEKLVLEFKNSKFKPEFVELPFDYNEGSAMPLTFKLENGKTAYMIGKADRVDTYRVNDKTYVRIADYKIGNKTFTDSELDVGKDLQLPIYLFSLREMESSDFKDKLLNGTKEIIPAGFFYVPLNIGKSTSTFDITKDVRTTLENEKKTIEMASAFKGRFLNDEDIISAQDVSIGGSLLPTSRSKSYISLEGFDEIYKKMTESIIAISNELYSGSALALPQEISGKDACEYCEQRAFCRRRQK
ncbi:MAG: hypothetical protein E7602_05705 [Ruminococcaceae bacterium]|nr:hypothetical protein [Oscillospiraceae bacterium]